NDFGGHAMKCASIAIEAHRIAVARYEDLGTDAAHRDMADILYRLAAAPTTIAGCAAVAVYVTTLPPGDLPAGWLPTFAGVVARMIQGSTDNVRYLGRVVSSDKEAAIARAMEEFRIEPARRLRLIVVPIE